LHLGQGGVSFMVLFLGSGVEVADWGLWPPPEGGFVKGVCLKMIPLATAS
jgi:hypothetical protein